MARRSRAADVVECFPIQGGIANYTASHLQVSLGGRTGRRQKTLKRASSKDPWVFVSVYARYGDGKVQTSFDGKNYNHPFTVPADATLELHVSCRAIRIRPARRSRLTEFGIIARD